MIRRLRDVKRYVKPLGQVSAEEWEEISDKASYAKSFKKDTNPLYTWFKIRLKEAEDDILENRLREVHNFEFNNLTETITKMFIIPKKIQDDETVGEIKLIRNLFTQLDFWIQEKARLEKDEADGKIIIQRDK